MNTTERLASRYEFSAAPKAEPDPLKEQNVGSTNAAGHGKDSVEFVTNAPSCDQRNRDQEA